jgi:pantothenate kinase
MDGFHLADVTLDTLALRDRKGAAETFDADGYAALLRRLGEPGERPVYAPGFERDLEQPLAAAVVVPAGARLVLTEGNYLLLDTGSWVAVREALDEVWFCVAEHGVRRERLVARHVAFGKTPDEAREWVERVDEPNAALVDATRSRADLVVRLD